MHHVYQYLWFELNEKIIEQLAQVCFLIECCHILK